MGFVGLYRAIYNYTPASDGELAIAEGDLLFVLERNTEDDWWRAKKRAAGAQDDEPEGLIPSNYIEEVSPDPVACQTIQCAYLHFAYRPSLSVTHEHYMITAGKPMKNSPSVGMRLCKFMTPQIRIGLWLEQTVNMDLRRRITLRLLQRQRLRLCLCGRTSVQ